MKKLITFLSFLLFSLVIQGQTKVNITKNMVIDEKNYVYSSPFNMFDEQSTINSELITTKPQTSWGSWNEVSKYYPLSAIIDLGTDIQISNIHIFDNTGSSDITFYYKNGITWELLFVDKLLNYQQWNKHLVNKTIRYIRVVSQSPSGSFNEVVLFSPAVVSTPIKDTVIVAPESKIKLLIKPSMLIDEKANPLVSPYTMFDEQDSLKPQTFWGNYINKDLYYPLSSIIDLGQPITITDINIYDLNGSANLSFYAKVNGVWELLFTDGLGNYGTWNKHTVNKTTQYIRIVSASPTGVFNEVIIYGNKNTIEPFKNSLAPKNYGLFSDFLGVNILHTNNIEDAKIFKNIREFHLWTWNEANTNIANYPGYPVNKYGFNPSPGNYWNFDNVYSSYKNRGLQIVPVLQGTAYWFNKATDDTKQDAKPVNAGANAEQPSSYVAHADYLYQFAARYGKTVLPSTVLKLQSDNQPLSGLNSVAGIENWNEPNKTWKERAGMFTPNEYAAMTSADYDGHQSQLGSKVGVKNADPNTPFIMGGLTGMDTVYLKSMLYWFKSNRTDGKIPFDVINYHHYSNDAGGQQGSPTYGISPEADNLEAKVKAAVNFNNRYLPGKQMWITEYGYDVSQSSSQKAKAYGPFTGEDVQAMWLVRSSLAIYTGGADKAFLFWLQDSGTNDYLFGSSGLLTPTKRKSYYWLATMASTIGQYKLTNKTVVNNYHTAVFKRPESNDTTIICLWSGTETGRSISNYTQYLSETNAILITPKVGSLTGSKTILPVVNGKVTLTVSEDPIYLKVWGRKVNARLEDKIIIDDALRPANIYPNPSNGPTYITSKNGKMITDIIIETVNGVIVRSINNLFTIQYTINDHTLPPGIYFVEIKYAGCDYVELTKLIIN